MEIPKRNIVIINIAGAFVWMFMYAYTPIFPVYVDSIGVSAAMLGIISGSYGIMTIILKIPLGIVMDRTKNDRLVLCVGFLLAVLSNLIFVLQDGNVVALIVARCLAGAGSSWWMVVSVLYAKYHPVELQVKAQGTLAATSNFGKIGGCLLSAVVAQYFGYEATFVVALFISVTAFFTMFGIRNVRQVNQTKRISLKEQLSVLKNRDLIAFSIISIISQIACFGLVMTFNQVAAERLGADSMQLGIMSMLAFVAAGLGSWFVGTKLYRKIGGLHATALGFVLGALGSIPFFFHINVASVFIMQMLGGACYGITQAALAGFVMRCVPVEKCGMATGVYQSLFGIGIFLGPVIMGYAIDGISFDAAYWIMFAMVALAVVLCYLWIPKKYGKMT